MQLYIYFYNLDVFIERFQNNSTLDSFNYRATLEESKYYLLCITNIYVKNKI